MLLRTRDLYARLIQDHPHVSDYQNDLAGVYNDLRFVYRRTKRQDQALAALRQALIIEEQLVRDHPSDPDFQNGLAISHYNLAFHWHHDDPRLDMAEAEYRRSVDLWEKLVRDHPLVLGYQHKLARSYGGLATIYKDTQRRDQAEDAFRRALPYQEKLAQAHPAIAEYAYDCAVTSGQMAELTRKKGQPKVALHWYSQAIRNLETVLELKKHHALAKQFLPDLHRERAQCLAGLGKHAEAIQDCERALALGYRRSVEMLRLERALSLAYVGQHARAIAEANELANKAPGSNDALYNAARVYAVSSAAVLEDASLPRVERDRLAEQYAVHAVGLLNKAHAAGFFEDPAHVAHLKKDADLTPLRERDDFKKLLATLAEKAKTEAR
jgi:tetratricopeptide (TPR) repeat protein